MVTCLETAGGFGIFGAPSVRPGVVATLLPTQTVPGGYSCSPFIPYSTLKVWPLLFQHSFLIPLVVCKDTGDHRRTYLSRLHLTWASIFALKVLHIYLHTRYSQGFFSCFIWQTWCPKALSGNFSITLQTWFKKPHPSGANKTYNKHPKSSANS